MGLSAAKVSKFTYADYVTWDDNERWEKYSFVKKLYDNRSSLFHGRKKKSEDARKNLASNIKEIQDIREIQDIKAITVFK